MDSIDTIFSSEGLYKNFSIESMIAAMSQESLDNKTDKIFILLFEPLKHDIVNKLISIRTGSKYTHAGLSMTGSFSQYYDMMPEGIRYLDGKEIKEDRCCDVFGFSVTKNQKNIIGSLIKEFMKKKIDGKFKYDFKALFAILFGFTKKDYNEDKLTKNEIANNGAYICSAFVAGVLAAVSQSVRNYIMQNKMKLTTIEPGQLMSFPGMEKEYTYNFETHKRQVTRE